MHASAMDTTRDLLQRVQNVCTPVPNTLISQSLSQPLHRQATGPVAAQGQHFDHLVVPLTERH
jgi:hypothetical protein